jgi:uncharacterized protein
MVRTLDGTIFARLVRAGALAVVREQEELDRINVFPVRDADTGANLAATLKAAAARLGSTVHADVGSAARVAADGALDGARGNSGAIFAQFLHGLAAAMEKRAAVDLREFAAAARRGAESAYSALADPREGTILTVVRAWAHELGRRDDGEDFVDPMYRALQAAREALANTPRQLEVLARSHVVDAGGQGFVYFVEGLLESLRGGHDVAWTPKAATPHGLPPFSDAHDEIDERFRYCTEALVVAREADGIAREDLTAAVRGLGESLVVAGSGERLRVHLHTNEPQLFLSTVAAYGAVTQSKVDDMVLQQLAGREATIAVVTDSTTQLPEAEAFRLGVVSVPLTLSLGDDEYLDGVDITLDGFIEKVTASRDVPHSSQPAAPDFAALYGRLLEYRQGVVSVHIAGAMSGTVQSARAAAREVDPSRIRVIDSCSVSVGAGLLVRAVGEAIAAGATLDEVQALAERARRDITIFGAVRSLDFAVRGGRVSPRLARAITALRLSALIAFDETGKARKGGVAFGFERALTAISRKALRFGGGRGAQMMVVHSGDAAAAERVAARLREQVDGDVPVVRAGAVLTTHVGLGTVSIAVRRASQ